MHDRDLNALYGLKWNPFLPAIPEEGLWQPPCAEAFFFRVENLLMDGGFAILTGDSGLGKSKLLHLLAMRMRRLDDVQVGVMERPQSTVGDFYRELGQVFGVELSPANRYGGFRALRQKWRDHIEATMFRPVLLVDEGQEMPTVCLNEIRLMSSAHFDSQNLVTTVLAGDLRLPDRFKDKALVPLERRMRCRLSLQRLDREPLMDFLNHSLDSAGAPRLMTADVKNALVEHAGGSLATLTSMGIELLYMAAERKMPQINEKLYFEAFSRQPPPKTKAPRRRR